MYRFIKLNWWESKIETSFHTTDNESISTTSTATLATVNYHSTNTFCMCPWYRTHQIATCFKSNYISFDTMCLPWKLEILLFHLCSISVVSLERPVFQCSQFSYYTMHHLSSSPSFLIIIFRLFHPKLVNAAKNWIKKKTQSNDTIRNTCIHTYHANKRDKIYWWLFILFFFWFVASHYFTFSFNFSVHQIIILRRKNLWLTSAERNATK